MVNTAEKSYFIKPLRPEHRRRRSANTQDETMHVVFTRHVPKQTCGVTKQDEEETLQRTTRYKRKTTERVTRDLYSTAQRVTGKKNLEVLLTADYTMFRQYGEDKLKEYLIVIMNIVASIFKQNSLGVDMTVTLIKLVIIKQESYGPNLVADENGLEAWSAIKQFSEWQLNEEQHKLLKPDLAAIVTRHDLYGFKQDGTIELNVAGRSFGIGTTCNTLNRCSINEDNGFRTAITIAHEMGHNLGMFHDGGRFNDCLPNKNIMAAGTAAQGFEGIQWSTCGANYLKEYLQYWGVNCLDKVSPGFIDISLDGRLPGEIVSLDEQCKMAYGDNSSACIFEQQMCKTLWCRRSPDDGCQTKVNAELEGSECLPGKWCRKGVCVDVGSEGPAPVDGGWSDYDEWTKCSRSCGGGVRSRRRRCDNPPPAYNGRICEGDAVMLDICNLQNCETSQLAFVQEQCANQSDHPSGEGFEWQPNYYFFNLNTFCKLNCARKEGNTHHLLEFGEFIDGSRCDSNDTYNAYKMCFSGRCENVGCDGKLNSEAVFDRCGNCNGDGSKCTATEASETVGGESYKFVHVISIPIGATSVIATDGGEYSFLGVQFNGEIVIGDDYLQRRRQGLVSAGVDLVYYSYAFDQVTIKGPTTAVIDIMVFKHARSPLYKANVSYSYYQKTSMATSEWSKGSWSTCSKSCGSGQETRDVTCTLDGRPVATAMCIGVKPNEQRPCDQGSCPMKQWAAGKYGQCSVTCGDGIKTRIVTCQSSDDEQVLDDSECNPDTKPDEQKPCSKPACCGETYTENAGSLTSPNYPNKYKANANCVTKIEITSGRQVKISFEVFKLQNSENCKNDYVKLTDEGTGTNAVFCGSLKPFHWTSETHIVKLEFHSNKGTNKKGFQADYESIETETNGYVPSCSMTMSKNGGVILSPSYPEPYKNNFECETVIQAKQSDVVELTLEEFEVEFHNSCRYDYLQITETQDGNVEDPLCGSRTGEVFEFTGGIKLLFHSDSSRSDKGFNISYKVVKAAQTS
ncbi:A disintegrin and metalloproteinase with thrombospondin motifs 16-like isoform X2 [Antedon mediterranea]